MKARLRKVDAIMPPSTVVPSEWRLPAPEPLANTRGRTPKMKANEVMRIGRKRMVAASTAASMSGRQQARIADELVQLRRARPLRRSQG
jgi:hypothetical protein